MTTDPTPPMGATSDGTLSDDSLGAVTWHSSEDDGGPDVGLDLGLGDGRSFYVGELSNACLKDAGVDIEETGDGWWIALTTPGGIEPVALVADQESARRLFDEITRLARRPAPPPPAPEGSDLDRLEAVARAATPGPWKANAASTEVRSELSDGRHVVFSIDRQWGENRRAINATYGETFDPPTVLALIAELRRLRAGEAAPSDALREKFRPLYDSIMGNAFLGQPKERELAEALLAALFPSTGGAQGQDEVRL